MTSGQSPSHSFFLSEPLFTSSVNEQVTLNQQYFFKNGVGFFFFFYPLKSIVVLRGGGYVYVSGPRSCSKQVWLLGIFIVTPQPCGNL